LALEKEMGLSRILYLERQTTQISDEWNTNWKKRKGKGYRKPGRQLRAVNKTAKLLDCLVNVVKITYKLIAPELSHSTNYSLEISEDTDPGWPIPTD
jgi:hypothetical protein